MVNGYDDLLSVVKMMDRYTLEMIDFENFMREKTDEQRTLENLVRGCITVKEECCCNLNVLKDIVYNNASYLEKLADWIENYPLNSKEKNDTVKSMIKIAKILYERQK